MSIQAAFMVPHPPMILPQIGRGREAQIQETISAYEQAAREIAALAPDTIIIASPHSVMYADYFHISPGRKAGGSFAEFGAPQVKFAEEYDKELVDRICMEADSRGFPAGTAGERSAKLDHGTMVPLWFIRNRYTRGKIVRIGLSGLPLTDHYEFGMLIRDAVNGLGRKAVFVASGDLSHRLQPYGPYGISPEGPVYDRRIMEAAGRGAFGELLDFDEVFCEKAAECGHRSFVIMAGALDGQKVRAKALSHQDVTGVGYGICTFCPEGEDASRHFLRLHLDRLEEELEKREAASDPYVRLARRSLETYIREGRTLPLPEDLPQDMLKQRAGVFVSIHKHGKLRGCIGTIEPVKKCVAQEIISNAISAATKDPRFDPVTPDELKWLEINVDVLGKPEKITSLSQLDVKRYGVIVSCGYRRGLLLPDLDGIDTPQQQVSIALQKGGIREDETCQMERFEVIRHT